MFIKTEILIKDEKVIPGDLMSFVDLEIAKDLKPMLCDFEYGEELYNFYFDEGGILGIPTVAITKNKLTEGIIMEYYIGMLNISSIKQIIGNAAFNWCIFGYPKNTVSTICYSVNI